jgi:hypothetical protein
MLFFILFQLILTMTVNSSININELSSSARSSLQTVFSCHKVDNTYIGPTFQLRRSSDNSEMSFYADTKGNLGMGLDATGTSLSSWLLLGNGSSATAYVTIWYDQSGHGRNAVQTIPTNQQ